MVGKAAKMPYGSSTNLLGVRQYLQDWIVQQDRNNQVAVGGAEPQPMCILAFADDGGDVTKDGDTSYTAVLVGRQGRYAVYRVTRLVLECWSGESYPPPLDDCGGVNTGVCLWTPWPAVYNYPDPLSPFASECTLPGTLACLSAGLCVGPAPGVYPIPYLWLLAVDPGWRPGKMWEATTEYVAALWADMPSLDTGIPSPTSVAWDHLLGIACAMQAPAKDPSMPDLSTAIGLPLGGL